MIALDNAITKYHTGKMQGIQSLSTSCLCNEYCIARQQNNNTICSKCYSKRELSRKKTLREKMEKNTKLLTEHDFKPEEIPFINSQIFRFEAFGELKNALQVKNYFAICEKNKHCTFALWTKNAWIIETALNDYKLQKPGNLIIIASVETVNNHFVLDETALNENLVYSFIDKVFAVYNRKYAEENNIPIKCGKKKCIDCMKCYSLDNDDFVITEAVKEETERGYICL